MTRPTMTRTCPRTMPLRIALLALASLAIASGACTLDKRKNAARAQAAARPVVERDVPNVLRGTIGSQAMIRGDEPILISGYGFVVGLDGTGSSDVPISVRTEIEAMMTAHGVGGASIRSGAFQNIPPSQLIESLDTAVVLLRAAIPPGAPAGTRFDIRVDALPGTSTTSLEGGTLYTADLFRGQIRPGNPATRPIAEARGPIFINPFRDPGAGEGHLRAGRILNGGRVTRPFPLLLFLDNPSHSRAAAIANAINTKFPRQVGGTDTAIGINDEQVEIHVPPSFRDRPREFIEILRHTRIDVAYQDEWAVRYTRALVEYPELSASLSWALRALGPAALPHLRPLYSHPELSPRLAALQAGAYLEDPLTRPHLEELVVSGSPRIRPEVLELLGRLGPDPRVNKFLRARLDDEQIDIQIAAYEALRLRADPIIISQRVDDKFILDRVPSRHPMIYVAQQREPRVVLFGDPMPIQVPVFARVWGDRLMVDATEGESRVRVFYLDTRTGNITQEPIKPEMGELIEFFAHRTTPEEPAPGLDLTYSEVVGALNLLIAEGVADARFVPETDRLALELLRSSRQDAVPSRPESNAQEDPAQPLWDELPSLVPAEERDAPEEPTNVLRQRQKRQFVVPIYQPPAKGGAGG